MWSGLFRLVFTSIIQETQMTAAKAVAISLFAMTAPAQAAVVYQFSDSDFTRTIITSDFIGPFGVSNPLANFCESADKTQSCDVYGGYLEQTGGDISCLFDHSVCELAYVYRVWYAGNFVNISDAFRSSRLSQFGTFTLDENVTLSITSLPTVPEPTVWAMLISGFVSAGAALRYSRHRIKV